MTRAITPSTTMMLTQLLPLAVLLSAALLAWAVVREVVG